MMGTFGRFMLAFCLLFAGAAMASTQMPPTAQSAQDFMDTAMSGNGTPDGVPPSVETICDGTTGAAHGLCTAYCEAMDCDSGSPQASQKACDKVRTNFSNITGQGLPCDCPCVTGFPGFADTLAGPLTGCFQIGAPGSGFDLVILQTDSSFWPASEVITGFGAACGNWFDGALFITEEQGKNCNNLLRQRAAQAGLSCNPS
ncbi:MAG TPA: hypothetical protein VJ725_23625 [Thermoanaerobaculia bacterium]|nr:hypothetical protein [Thermoanaerobaculia bacterium]